MIVGVTGKIGSGKSTVRKIFTNMGVKTVDCDELAHQFIHVKDRKIAELIFSNKELLSQIENIIHPYIIDYLVVESINKTNNALVVEFPLLFINKISPFCNKIILVEADNKITRHRLLERNYSEKEIKERLSYYENINYTEGLEKRFNPSADLIYIQNNDNSFFDLYKNIQTLITHELTKY